jgi:hypothetical protein
MSAVFVTRAFIPCSVYFDAPSNLRMRKVSSAGDDDVDEDGVMLGARGPASAQHMQSLCQTSRDSLDAAAAAAKI